jgi:hypothetical protein
MVCQFFRPICSLLLVLAASACIHGQNVNLPVHATKAAELKSLEIKQVKLFSWQVVQNNRKYVEVQEFRETQELHLFPSSRFDVKCEVVGGSDVGDYFLWTTVDFLVAPVTRAYEQMDNSALASSVSWGQMTEMRDLKGTPIYWLRPKETRQVVVKGLDLSPVLKSFPVGEDGELWPWLVRVTIHVLDRSGKQITNAERISRLVPTSARRISRYNDPLLSDKSR